MGHEFDVPKYTAKSIAKQISKPYRPRYIQRGMEINCEDSGDYRKIARYFRPEKSFSLILDYRSRLFNYIQKNSIQDLEDWFEWWIEDPGGAGKGKGQFSDNRDINSITGDFLGRFMKREMPFEWSGSTPLVVAQSKTKIWIGEPNKTSGLILIGVPQGSPMFDDARKEMYELPCFFWEKSDSGQSENSWIKPFGVPGYRHPPKNLQWVLYREFICTHSSTSFPPLCMNRG